MSTAFSGKSRVERHRAVNELLAPELKGAVHALAIEPAAPGESTAGRRRGFQAHIVNHARACDLTARAALPILTSLGLSG